MKNFLWVYRRVLVGIISILWGIPLAVILSYCLAEMVNPLDVIDWGYVRGCLVAIPSLAVLLSLIVMH